MYYASNTGLFCIKKNSRLHISGKDFESSLEAILESNSTWSIFGWIFGKWWVEENVIWSIKKSWLVQTANATNAIYWEGYRFPKDGNVENEGLISKQFCLSTSVYLIWNKIINWAAQKSYQGKPWLLNTYFWVPHANLYVIHVTQKSSDGVQGNREENISF